MTKFTFKQYILVTILFFMGLNFAFSQQTNINRKPEYMKFDVQYGILDGGQVEIKVDTGLQYIDGKVCHKIGMWAQTVGMVGWFSKINNEWYSLVDTTTKLPYKFVRNIQENNYRLKEVSTYDRAKSEVFVSTQTDTSEFKVNVYKTSAFAHDLVSAYFAFRFYDFADVRKKDTLSIPVFIEDKQYIFKMRYIGKKKIKTIFGKKTKAIVISPIMPPNKMFKSGDDIRAYFSDDEFKIPLKMEAELVVGSIEAELKEYR